MRRGPIFTLGLVACSLATLLIARAPRSQTQAQNVGNDKCAECHEPQIKSFMAGSHGRASGEHGGDAQVSCEGCHGPGSLHVEADNDRSNPGFDTMRKYGKGVPAATINATCLSCHKGGEQFYWEHSSHARKGVACTQCHSMHAAEDEGGAKMLKAKNATEQCFTCHKSKKFTMARSAHMPIAEGGMTCTECHNPHGTPNPKQLRATSNNELCEKCHADKRGPLLWEHAPVRENCVTCHEPHGANNDKVLTAKKPFLCQRCHIGTRHPATLYDLPDLQSNRLFNRSCTNCHTQVHGSNHPSGKFFLR